MQVPPEDGRRLCVTADASEKYPTLSIRAVNATLDKNICIVCSSTRVHSRCTTHSIVK